MDDTTLDPDWSEFDPEKPIGFACTRLAAEDCAQIMWVPAKELVCPNGDPALLPVLTPREGWLVDEDEHLVCHQCATPDELEEDTHALAAAAQAWEDAK